MQFHTRILRVVAGITMLAIAVIATQHVRAEVLSVKVSLPWKFQGPDSFMLLAEDAGYYAEAGLKTTIDSGKGSVDAITRVASGVYSFGFADINNLIQYNSQHPDKLVKAVMMVYNQSPFSLFTLKGRGITKPKDLEGRTLGAPVFDSSFKLFPAFVDATAIDGSKVKKQNMDPTLREAMLIRGDVDFISGHYFSSFMDLKSKGVKPEDMIVMRYSDYGLDFYGNAVIASNEMLTKHPEKVAGFVQATIRAVQDILADPKKGAAAAKKRDDLVDEALELERLQLAIDTLILTPDVRKNGIGGVNKARLARSIDQVALAFGLKRKPLPEEMFAAEFLPPKSRRMPPK